MHTIPHLVADDLRGDIAKHLRETQIYFALHERGADLVVPGHRPIAWASMPAPGSKRRSSPLSIYEETTALVLSYLIERFDARVFYDVGAAIGYFSRIAASHLSTNVSAHAFEITPPRLEALRAVIAEEGLEAHITANLAGLTDSHKGEAEMWYARGLLFESPPDPNTVREAWWRRIKFALRGDTSRELRSARALMTSLDHYAKATGAVPDIIKIDVEGYEGAVLKGGRDLFSTRRPFVLLELHTDKKLRFGMHRQDVTNLLFDLGYQALFFTDHQSRKECEIVEVEAAHPLLARQETDLILFFHRDYLIERRQPSAVASIG